MITTRAQYGLLLLILMIAAGGTGCGIGDTLNSTLNPAEPSPTPVATIIASETSVKRGTVVSLNGASSFDPQSVALTFAWVLAELPTGSAAAVSTATGSVITLTLDKGGYYTVTLQVTNANALVSNIATVRLDAVGTGSNHPPVAVAGADATATIGDAVVFDASGSFDADQDNITYTWDMVDAPLTSALTSVISLSELRSTFTPDVAGIYTIILRTSDGIDTDEDFILITAS